MSTGNANMDPSYPLVPTANLAACLLVICSLSQSMFQSWNVGACSFAIWTALGAFITAVNSFIWYNNATNVAPIWCDISEYVLISSYVLKRLTENAQKLHTLMWVLV